MKKLLVLAPIAIACASLSGCGVVAMENSRTDMMKTKQAYTKCLEKNSTNLSVCDGYKVAYRADMEAYNATAANLRPCNDPAKPAQLTRLI